MVRMSFLTLRRAIAEFWAGRRIHPNDANKHGYSIQLRCVDYDREAVIKAIELSRHPTPFFLIGFMRGERVPSSDPGFFQVGRHAENQGEK